MILTAAQPRRSTFVVAALCTALLATAAPATRAAGELLSFVVIAGDTGEAAALTRQAGGSVEQPLEMVDGVAARLSASSARMLARRALVVPNRPMRVRSDSFDGALGTTHAGTVGATGAWDAGIDGAGVTVALVDTGVADVPDLQDRVVASANLTRERDDADTYGHGTFQAGLIAGDGSSSGGRTRGIAPGASLLSVKVADASGATSLAQVLAGIQVVYESAQRFGVRVMLLALDSESPLPPELDPLSRALRTLWANGVVVVVPAGNDGATSGAIASPGEDPVLLTSGATDEAGTPGTADDTVAGFSSNGPTRWGDHKPDLVAPGAHLVSVRAPGSTVDRENPSARVGDDYFRGSGTSMAAAVTAGSAALMLAARPELAPDQVKELLGRNAVTLDGATAEAAGAGSVNVSAALADTAPLAAPGTSEELDTPVRATPPGLRAEWVRGPDGRWRWVARQWAARQWAARQWTDEEWDELGWAARQWAARQWAARQWMARQWVARQWVARQWAEDGWEARQWAARQWAEEEWQARQWTARQWTARQWTARQWMGVTWG